MSFKLGGKTATELGLIMDRSSQRPVLPGTRDRTLVIAGRHGLYDFGADMDARSFEFVCGLAKRDHIELQQAIRTLTAHLIDARGRPRTMELVFDQEPQRSYTVRYSGSLPIERLAGLGMFTLPLLAVDPFAYGPFDEYDVVRQYDSGLQYDTGLLYPNPTGFDWLYPEQRSSLQNYSALETDIVITIEGAATVPKITHEQSGKWLQLPSITGSDTLVIDTEKYTVKKNGVNALSETAGDFFKLATGENGFKFEALNPNAVVSYSWQHKYL